MSEPVKSRDSSFSGQTEVVVFEGGPIDGQVREYPVASRNKTSAPTHISIPTFRVEPGYDPVRSKAVYRRDKGKRKNGAQVYICTSFNAPYYNRPLEDSDGQT